MIGAERLRNVDIFQGLNEDELKMAARFCQAEAVSQGVTLCEEGARADKLFILEDWHHFGPDYEKTLLAWYRTFETHRKEIEEQYSPRFCRMWKFYLLGSAGSFRARETQLWQIVLSRRGVVGGYASVR